MKINWFKIDSHNVLQEFSWILKNHAFALYFIPIYLKQGFKCKDCEKNYYHCTCDFVEQINIQFLAKIFSKKNLKILFNWLKKDIPTSSYVNDLRKFVK